MLLVHVPRPLLRRQARKSYMAAYLLCLEDANRVEITGVAGRLASDIGDF
jgi:hypothetical protein